MEAILKDSNKVQGTEVLFFDDAEIEKTKFCQHAFASAGHLSVLYFKDYKRYVLQLNDWKYPLLRRLPIVALDKNDMTSRSYTLPGLNGFSYLLKIRFPNTQSLANFENVLCHNSNFAYKGEEAPFRKYETSPDDGVHRLSKEKTSLLEKVSETMKAGMEKIRVKTETFKTGTKDINSRKKMVHLKDIKNKNFKKNAHSTFKKDFFKNSEKLSDDFLRMRRENLSMTQTQNFEDLSKTHGPSIYVARCDIENNILKNKDLACSGQCNIIPSIFTEKKDIPNVQTVSPGKQTIAGRQPKLSDAPGHIVTMMMGGFDSFEG
jgi:hypothetical protein